MNNVWMLTAEDIELVYDEAKALASQRGKKAGDSFTDEIIELLIKKGKKLEYLGSTEKNIDVITGDLRESGIKVHNLNEEERRRKNARSEE
jgi:predicted CopG family antitoxin